MLAQREHTVPGDPNFYDQSFYVHDRLGSVRQVVDYNDIDAYAFVANSYTYSPFGSPYDGAPAAETVDNPFKFTGQYHDAEINQYYLRARQYDPTMMRFTSRDSVMGKYQEPLTYHKYLYCWNSPINYLDPSGEYGIADAIVAGYEWHASAIMVAAIGVEQNNWDMIVFGAFMDSQTSTVILLAMISSKNAARRGACFTEGTLVLTPIGDVPIEQIKAGWYVWAPDPKTKELSLFEVIRCFKRQTDKLIMITVDGEEIETTPDHPFYVYAGKWRAAGELRVGTELTDVNGNPKIIEKIEVVSGQVTVYNFEVADSHTYYVSSQHLLVHNNDCSGPRPDHLSQPKGKLSRVGDKWLKKKGIDPHKLKEGLAASKADTYFDSASNSVWTKIKNSPDDFAEFMGYLDGFSGD